MTPEWKRIHDLAERLAEALIEIEIISAKLRKEREKTATLEMRLSKRAGSDGRPHRDH